MASGNSIFTGKRKLPVEFTTDSMSETQDVDQLYRLVLDLQELAEKFYGNSGRFKNHTDQEAFNSAFQNAQKAVFEASESLHLCTDTADNCMRWIHDFTRHNNKRAVYCMAAVSSLGHVVADGNNIDFLRLSSKMIGEAKIKGVLDDKGKICTDPLAEAKKMEQIVKEKENKAEEAMVKAVEKLKVARDAIAALAIA